VTTTKAVILARGLGTRMRRDDAGAALDDAQARAAEAGMKAMIPIGRPFLDHVLSALADAGITDTCLVIGPEHGAIRAYFTSEAPPERMRVHFAEQATPRGTADAVLAAEAFVAGEVFLVLNADNHYPAEVLRALRKIGGAGTVGFDRETLVREGNIEAERVASYALMDVRADGTLARIVEKPDAATFAAMRSAPVSMNCWSLPPSIFAACRAIAPSARGELELPAAVQYAVDEMCEEFRVVPMATGVLDLSRRGDIAAVAERLRGVEARP
jgi:dTDP-glucose pyrophosphorylase